METVKTACVWCGSTDQNLIIIGNNKPACEDWVACAERELKKGAEQKPEPFQLPFGRKAQESFFRA